MPGSLDIAPLTLPGTGIIAQTDDGINDVGSSGTFEWHGHDHKRWPRHLKGALPIQPAYPQRSAPRFRALLETEIPAMAVSAHLGDVFKRNRGEECCVNARFLVKQRRSADSASLHPDVRSDPHGRETALGAFQEPPDELVNRLACRCWLTVHVARSGVNHITSEEFRVKIRIGLGARDKIHAQHGTIHDEDQPPLLRHQRKRVQAGLKVILFPLVDIPHGPRGRLDP